MELFMSLNKKNKIDQYLDSLSSVFDKNSISREFWPLKPAQMTACFDDSLAVDIYKRIDLLKKQKVPLEKVAKMFDSPSMLRNFLENFASIGLKVAHNVGWFKISFKEREVFFNYLFRVLKKMSKNDIFIRDGKQIILSTTELKNISPKKFIKTDDKNSKIIKIFNLSLFGLVWAMYFDTFYYTGFSTHGPYRVSKKFGIKNGVLVISDYFNLRPVGIWSITKKVPFEKVRIYSVYENADWSINFFERTNASVDLSNRLVFFEVEIDGKIIKDLEKIEKLTQQIFEINQKQTDAVNSLSNLEKIKKASEISYYGLRGVFDHFNESWNPPKEIDEVIRKNGEDFIKKFDYDLTDYSSSKIRKLFDPRNNWY